ncbi:YbaB/EbfC family nucleoid-associated protein [Streptomyces sp. NPDC097610]|uniref:YbaB/EbfC family nucleoid-associated protein n=1 Tax=Streptomyces sp. NPDC097610 TaxID=3157227 RepID=UPI00331C1302
MSTPYEQGTDDLPAACGDKREEPFETGRRSEVTGTSSAPRQCVRVTVGAEGDITEIDFLTDDYQRMAPKELSEVLVAAVWEARKRALEQVAESTSAPRPPEAGIDNPPRGGSAPARPPSEKLNSPPSVGANADDGKPGNSGLLRWIALGDFAD